MNNYKKIEGFHGKETIVLPGSNKHYLIGYIRKNKEIIIKNENIPFLLNAKYAILKKQ